jgi:hypothetical protein
MAYELMLLADPGPARSEVLRALEEAPDVRRDPDLDNRFWLASPEGEAQINIGTKDPVESVHLEFEIGPEAQMEAVTRRALALAGRLGMRLEDVLWGHEVGSDSFPELREHWARLANRPPVLAGAAEKRPWWRLW